MLKSTSVGHKDPTIDGIREEIVLEPIFGQRYTKEPVPRLVSKVKKMLSIVMNFG